VNQKESKTTIITGFLKSAEAFGNRPAVAVSSEVFTYLELFRKSAALAATLAKHQPDP